LNPPNLPAAKISTLYFNPCCIGLFRGICSVEIKIKTEEELKLLFETLSKEIVDASIYHQLLYGLMESKQKNQQAYNESNTFWYLTFQALNDARMIRLCRVYDTHSKSLNIVNLLDT